RECPFLCNRRGSRRRFSSPRALLALIFDLWINGSLNRRRCNIRSLADHLHSGCLRLDYLYLSRLPSAACSGLRAIGPPRWWLSPFARNGTLTAATTLAHRVQLSSERFHVRAKFLHACPRNISRPARYSAALFVRRRLHDRHGVRCADPRYPVHHARHRRI